jgi:hypothetical protein
VDRILEKEGSPSVKAQPWFFLDTATLSFDVPLGELEPGTSTALAIIAEIAPGDTLGMTVDFEQARIFFYHDGEHTRM